MNLCYNFKLDTNDAICVEILERELKCLCYLKDGKRVENRKTDRPNSERKKNNKTHEKKSPFFKPIKRL